MSDGESKAVRARVVPEWWWPVAGLVIGVWAMLPNFVSPALATSERAEFADHVVPGIVLVLVSAAALFVLRGSAPRSDGAARAPSPRSDGAARAPSPRSDGAARAPAPPPSFMFVAGLVVVLAGLWMFATHVPLVAQAMREEAPWGATLYHTASAVTVLLFGILWVATHWNDI